jgi:hypothetical protein
VGLFDFLRSKDERAIPEPGTPEFEAAVSGSALPGSVEMGQAGWTKPSSADQLLKRGGEAGEGKVTDPGPQTIDLRGTGARKDVEKVLREHGVDPDKKGQQIDAGSIPGLKEALLGVLGMSGMQIPNAGGFAGGISPPKQDPIAVVEHLAKEKQAGRISEAEFEAQKKQILGE